MRKSERLRQVELELVRLNFELEFVKAILANLAETAGTSVPDMDAGKWYNKTRRPDIPNN